MLLHSLLHSLVKSVGFALPSRQDVIDLLISNGAIWCFADEIGSILQHLFDFLFGQSFIFL